MFVIRVEQSSLVTVCKIYFSNDTYFARSYPSYKLHYHIFDVVHIIYNIWYVTYLLTVVSSIYRYFKGSALPRKAHETIKSCWKYKFFENAKRPLMIIHMFQDRSVMKLTMIPIMNHLKLVTCYLMSVRLKEWKGSRRKKSEMKKVLKNDWRISKARKWQTRLSWRQIGNISWSDILASQVGSS